MEPLALGMIGEPIKACASACMTRSSRSQRNTRLCLVCLRSVLSSSTATSKRNNTANKPPLRSRCQVSAPANSPAMHGQPAYRDCGLCDLGFWPLLKSASFFKSDFASIFLRSGAFLCHDELPARESDFAFSDV